MLCKDCPYYKQLLMQCDNKRSPMYTEMGIPTECSWKMLTGDLVIYDKASCIVRTIEWSIDDVSDTLIDLDYEKVEIMDTEWIVLLLDEDIGETKEYVVWEEGRTIRCPIRINKEYYNFSYKIDNNKLVGSILK